MLGGGSGFSDACLGLSLQENVISKLPIKSNIGAKILEGVRLFLSFMGKLVSWGENTYFSINIFEFPKVITLLNAYEGL